MNIYVVVLQVHDYETLSVSAVKAFRNEKDAILFRDAKDKEYREGKGKTSRLLYDYTVHKITLE